MKLSLKSALREVARWKREGVPAQNLMSQLNQLKNKNFFIHFTNNPKKIGFHPDLDNRPYIGNPLGYYGFPLNDQFFEDKNMFMSTSESKYLVIWRPKSSARLINWDDVINWIEDLDKNPITDDSSLGGNDGPKLTKMLISAGYDGVVSGKGSGQMSGDIQSEIVIFKPSNVEVLHIFPNTFFEDLDATNANVEATRKRPSWEGGAKKQWQDKERYHQSNSRKFRKNNPI